MVFKDGWNYKKNVYGPSTKICQLTYLWIKHSAIEECFSGVGYLAFFPSY